jgi:hypothetical protein
MQSFENERFSFLVTGDFCGKIKLFNAKTY